MYVHMMMQRMHVRTVFLDGVENVGHDTRQNVVVDSNGLGVRLVVHEVRLFRVAE